MRVELPPGIATLSGLDVRVTPLFPLPDEPARWLEEQLRDETAPYEVLGVHDLPTADGWPASLLEVELTGGARKTRAIALFGFLGWAAAVTVECADPSLYQTRRAELLELLGKARPIFRGAEPICLHDILGDLPR